MFQVTAMYQDEEVGYGEGESYEWAAQECSESVSDVYPSEDVMLVCTHGVVQVSTPLDLHREAAR